MMAGHLERRAPRADASDRRAARICCISTIKRTNEFSPGNCGSCLTFSLKGVSGRLIRMDHLSVGMNSVFSVAIRRRHGSVTNMITFHSFAKCSCICCIQNIQLGKWEQQFLRSWSCSICIYTGRPSVYGGGRRRQGKRCTHEYSRPMSPLYSVLGLSLCAAPC